MTRTLAAWILFTLTLFALGPLAQGGTSRVWVAATFEDFKGGKGEGVLVTSNGRLERGEAGRRVSVGTATMVFAAVEVGEVLYLGTGTSGEIWRYQGGKTSLVTSLPGAVLVTSFARGPGSTLYAGTLPEGKIFALDTRTGKATLFSTLDAKHVWALLYQERTRTLFAATGPGGKLFAVDAQGKSRVHWDSKEEHLLGLTLGPGGDLYVGTSPKAIVYRILGPGRARALHDFSGNEVRALVGNDRFLAAAVNDIKADPSSDVRMPPHPPRRGTAIRNAPRGPVKLPIPRLGAKKGKGGLFLIQADGSATQVFATATGYFTALELTPDGRVHAAEGTEGRVVTVLPDHSTAVSQDVPERQVLSLALGGKVRAFGTGDGGALYVLGAGAPAPTYTSAAFDTGNGSRFGLLSLRATGALGVEVRSGNTAEPDPGWSTWQAVALRRGGPGGLETGTPRCPPARYVQFRLTWRGASRAVVREVRLHFTPTNQPPLIKELVVGEIGSGKTAVQKPVWLTSQSTTAPTELKITWKVEDPDGDPLVYRLWFRALGDVSWRRLTDDPTITATNTKWKTDSLADGWYEVRLQASDESSNGAGRVRRSELVSAPVLVDNGKPDLVGLRVAYPVVTGLARDRFSRITGVAYSLNGKLWRQVEPLDGVWDQEAERFDFRIDPAPKPGIHTLLVRAYDEAGNARIVKLPLRVP